MRCTNFDCRQARLKADEIEKQLRARVAQLEQALELIAAPKRKDGTYNRSREACEQLARAALNPVKAGTSVCRHN